MQKLLVTLGLLWVSSPHSATAGALLVEHFETLRGVHVSISTGGLQHDPLPGFDKDEFESHANKRVVSNLGRCDLREIETFEPRLWIRLRQSRTGLSEGRVLLQVTAELRESAYLKRHWREPTSDKSIMVTTWQTSRSSIVEEHEAIEHFLELISRVSEEFVETVAEARANSETAVPGLGHVPEACLDSESES